MCFSHCVLSLRNDVMWGLYYTIDNTKAFDNTVESLLWSYCSTRMQDGSTRRKLQSCPQGKLLFEKLTFSSSNIENWYFFFHTFWWVVPRALFSLTVQVNQGSRFCVRAAVPGAGYLLSGPTFASASPGPGYINVRMKNQLIGNMTSNIIALRV